MQLNVSPTSRAVAAGAAAAALLIGAFALGTGQTSAATSTTATTTTTAASSPATRITVTGTGTVTGTPNQLTLSMGVQTNGASVSAALASANRAVRAVSGALRRDGVAASDIQTADLSIQPNYQGSGAVPSGYGVSESIQVTLSRLSAAGSQISAAVHAGGNATVVDGVSLNLTDSSALLAAARAKAVADARTKAAEYAKALGSSLGPVISMSEVPPPQPEPFFGVNGATPASGHAASVPVHPGSQQLSVTITAIFSLA